MAGNNIHRDEARERARLISVASNTVDLDLTTGDATFRSTAVIRFDCREPGAGTHVNLTAPAVQEVTLNGTALDPDAVFDGNRITLDTLAAANELRVVADCLYMRTGEGLHRFVDPVDDEVYLYTQFETFDAHRMYACFDQPDLKAVFELAVTAPRSWQVVSNMAPVGDPDPAGAESSVWRFVPTPKMSTYITALIAGSYAVVRDRHGDIDLGIYCRQSLAEHLDADELFTVTKQGFDFFEREFDYAYPFGKYDQLFVPEFNAGAMENAGAVTFLEDYIFRSKVTDAAYERRAETVLHEMAHMWFGDLVTMRWWDDLWLNESFATYMSHLTVSEVTRFTNAWTTFCNSWKGYGYRADQLPSTHPISADVVDTDSALLNFDGISYGKGAAVLKQLVAWVGREEFLAGVRAYFRDHEFANTTLADLLAALEKASGRDLAAWAAAWLRTAGVNTLRPAVQVSAGAYTYVAVEQEAPVEHPTLRPHRVGIGLYDLSTEGLVRRQRLEIDIDGARTEVSELAGVRQPDLLLVNDDDLTYAKIRLDERSLATVLEHAGEIRESLPRTLCWNAAWDMTRDAELPARDYVRLVVAGVAAEDDIGVAQSLLANARNAANFYADPAYRPELLRSLAELSRGRMCAAEPGSDVQLTSARAFTLAATTGDEVAAVQAMLDGTAVPSGLSIDAELRWHLLLRLVDLGAAGDSEIDAELDRDRTATGEQQAAAARAGRPEAAAKAAAWAALVDSNALSNRLVTSTAGGFWRSEQLALCRPYVDRYFAALAQIWRTRTPEIARQLTTLLYPSLLVEPATLARTDVHLSTADLPTGLRRLLGEHRDDVARALRARACDSAATPAR